MVTTKGWATIDGHPVLIDGAGGSGGSGSGKTKSTSDTLSGALFGGGPATVVIPKMGRVELDQASQNIFGRTLQDAEYADLVGAPSNGTVKVYAGKLNGREHITIRTTADGYDDTQIRRVYKAKDGKVEISNDIFTADETFPPGAGTRVFASQVATARRLGVARIVTEAARDENANGYYTWPRFGYDGDLADSSRQSLPAELGHARRVSDLMQTSAGRAWWKTHGESISVSFDLTSDSLSSRVLDGYLHEREVRL